MGKPIQDNMIEMLSLGYRKYFKELLHEKYSDLSDLQLVLLAELCRSKQITMEAAVNTVYNLSDDKDLSFIEDLVVKGYCFLVNGGEALKLADNVITEDEYAVGQLASCPLPITHKPNKLMRNTDSIYQNSIGNVVSHSNTKEDVNLDVINELQSIKLKLTDFAVTECMPDPLHHKNVQFDSIGALYQWQRKVKYRKLLVDWLYYSGNRALYFSWFYDRRGRFYSNGYLLNPQGTEQDKACLEFAKEELVKEE